MEDKTYSLRDFEFGDLFVMSTIIHKIGVKSFRDCITPEMVSGIQGGDGQAEAVEKIGLQVFLSAADVILGHLEDCKADIYRLLERLSGIKVKELDKLPMGDAAEMLVEMFQKERFADFFSQAAKLLPKGK